MNINDIKARLEIVKEDLQDDTKQLNKIEIKLLDADTMDYKTYKATMTLYNRAKNNIEKDKEIIKTLEKRLSKALEEEKEEEEKKINTVEEVNFQEINNDMVKDARLEYNVRDKKVYVYRIEKLKFIINCKNIARKEVAEKLPINEYVSFKYK